MTRSTTARHTMANSPRKIFAKAGYRPNLDIANFASFQMRIARGGTRAISGNTRCLGRSDCESAGPSGYPFFFGQGQHRSEHTSS
jgi:hypothetical protein